MVPSLVPTTLGTVSSDNAQGLSDPNLNQITADWSRLPEAIKTAILTLVQAAGGSDA